TADQADTIKADLATYAKKIDGVDTDYWSAMDGARREFSERVQGQATPCNLLMWFSDGEFDLKPRESDGEVQQLGGLKPWAPDNALRSEEEVRQAVDAGANDLCRPAGLADQSRSLDIITVGIGLSVADEGQDAPNFDLMRGISTGESTSACGDLTTPKPGEFVMATDVDDLIYSFITALDPGGSGENEPCVGDICAEGTRTFVLDGSIGAVSATAKAPVDGTRIYLKTRTGEDIELTQGTGEQSLNGSKLTWEWVTPRVLTMDLVRDGQGDWAGPWGIVFVADAPTEELAKSTISLKGDITPRLKDKPPALRSGESPLDLAFEVVDSSGTRIDPTTLSDETTLTVTLNSGGQAQQLASGLVKDAIEQPITLPLDKLQPGIAELVLTLDVTTQSWEEDGERVAGTKLEPRHASVPLNIAPPADFPSIPAKVSFGQTEQPDPVSIDVPIDGEGCVWLAGETKFTGFPAGLDKAQLSSPATSRDTCASGSMQLTLSPGGVANGSFVGTTTVMLAAANADVDPVSVELAFDLSQRRPASQPVLWTTLIGVTLLGVAIPLGILYLT
ncbi:MAG: hypothetical protein Q4G46_16465, partial [Propionibacteriaceae bacterium]|nr:hypothetical protein [Propionibacteriaceae bacterium]